MKTPALGFTIFFVFVTASQAADVQYVKQILEPVGGKIDRPTNWYYVEGHTPKSWLWTISREKSKNSSYDVGVRIQTAINVEEISGKTPRQFVLEYKEKKKAMADKVMSECKATNQGLFSRVCLETEEGRFRILFSLLWGNNMDVIVITTSGAPKTEWKKYAGIFNHMAEFQLIDMKRFKRE